MRKKKRKYNSIIRSSSTLFPVEFTHEGVVHSIGKDLDLNVWCQDENVKKLSVLDKFMIFSLQPRFQNQTYLSHNGSRFGIFKFVYLKKIKICFPFF